MSVTSMNAGAFGGPSRFRFTGAVAAFAAVAAMPGAVFGAVRRYMKDLEAAEDLHRQSDHMLDDIGISRDQITGHFVWGMPLRRVGDDR
jgi:uncharacterized protein YjiS (DUF1127 family)